MTHVVQIIPQLDEKRIKTLQKAVNDFIWKKGYQKKTVVDFETAQLPPWAGGLGIPNIGKFWDALLKKAAQQICPTSHQTLVSNG